MNIFEKAAQLISEGGHCKRTPKDGTAYCASGALHAAAGWTGGVDSWSYDSKPAYEAAKKAGRRLYEKGEVAPDFPAPILDLVDWNNAPERTGEDVILLFKELAAEDG